MKTQLPHNRRQISPKLILSFLVAVVIFFLLLTSVIGLAEKHHLLTNEIDTLEEKQSELKDKQATLTATNEYLDTPEGKEHVFRDKYNVVRPGEGMIVITSGPAPITASPASRSVISRWWDSILHGVGIRTE